MEKTSELMEVNPGDSLALDWASLYSDLGCPCIEI